MNKTILTPIKKLIAVQIAQQFRDKEKQKYIRNKDIAIIS